MIDVTQVKKLAELSRIAISDSEAESLSKEMASILGYIDQIKTASADIASPEYSLVNVMRDDTYINETGSNTETVLNAAPAREGQYVKVKKILGGQSQ